MSLADRRLEITELQALADRREPVLALLYGRRRVGKTFLLDHAWQHHRHFYFLAADTTADLNRQEMLRELRATFGASVDGDHANYPSWRTVFRLFAELAIREPLVVVLDEFQYLMAKEDDIVLSERITGVPVAVIRTPYIERMGLTAGPVARWMLRHRRTKHFMRTVYALRSLWQLKRASFDETGAKDYWQAGKSVAAIESIEPAGEIVRRFGDAVRAAD